MTAKIRIGRRLFSYNFVSIFQLLIELNEFFKELFYKEQMKSLFPAVSGSTTMAKKSEENTQENYYIIIECNLDEIRRLYSVQVNSYSNSTEQTKKPDQAKNGFGI